MTGTQRANLHRGEHAERLAYWDWDITADRITWPGSLPPVRGAAPGAAGATFLDFLGLVHPDDRDRVGAAMRQAVAAGTPWEEEFRLADPAGTYRWALTRGQVHADKDGRPARMTGIEIDVTARKRAEEQVRRGEAEYRSLFEAAGIGNAEIAIDTGRFVRVNRTYCELTGYTADELLGMTFLDLTHPDDRARNALAIAPFLREERDRFEIEKRYVRKDGSTVWVHLAGTLIRDEEGRPVRVLGSAQDIGERKRADERLRDSEVRFRATFENAAVGIAHVAPDGRWLRVNATLSAITGYTREELLARTFQDITHPDDLGADLEHVRRLLDGQIATYAMEKRYIRKDGETVWVNLTVALARTAAGAPDFFISAIEDISARKQAEEDVRRLNAELGASLQELRTILDTAPVGIGVARDPACKVIVGNRALAEIFGMAAGENVSLSRADAQAPPYRLLKGGKDVPPETLPLQRAAAAGVTVVDDLYEVVRADGSRGQVVVRANPVSDGAGAVVGAVGICHDVTALKQAEAALQEADRRKNEFLAMLAHELRNPLAAIANANALARGDGLPAEDLRWAIDVIDRQVRQLRRLIDDLLDVSRISRGKIHLKRERVDAAAVVARAVESVRNFIAERGHELFVAVSSEPMPLDADPARLVQVLANLLNNAAKYTDPGGRIALAAAPEGDEVVLRVRDNGVGIPRAMLAQVFDLFAQVEDSVARSHGGLGIGLSLVRSLTELHGGRVTLASEGAGLGTEATVRLPRLSALPAAPAPGTGPPARPAPRRGRICRILVVDDNADTLRGMARLLARLGHEAFTALDGPSALAAVREHRPEVVVLDIGLPGMSGYDVAAIIRQEVGDGVTLIALSGYAQERDRQRSCAAGFDHHLAKPVDLDQLCAIIEASDAG